MDIALLAQPPAAEPQLGIAGFRYSDLNDAARLADLTRAFDDFVRAADGGLFARYQAHRSVRLRGPAESELLLQLGSHLSRFVGKLFGVEPELSRLRDSAGRDAPLFRVKRDFVQRRVFKKGAKDRPLANDFAALDAQVRPLLGAAARRDPRASLVADDAELLVAVVVDTLLDAASAQPASLHHFAWTDLLGALERGLKDGSSPPATPLQPAPLLDLFDKWLYALSLQPNRPAWLLLRLPHAVDFQQLVPLRRPMPDRPEVLEGHADHQRRRDGFTLTDPRMDPREVRSEIDYCI